MPLEEVSCRLCARIVPVGTSWHVDLRGSWSLSRIRGRRGFSCSSEGRGGLGVLQGGPGEATGLCEVTCLVCGPGCALVLPACPTFCWESEGKSCLQHCGPGELAGSVLPWQHSRMGRGLSGVWRLVVCGWVLGAVSLHDQFGEEICLVNHLLLTLLLVCMLPFQGSAISRLMNLFF